MLAITAAWGSCFLGIRWGLRDAPLLWFAALRALLAGGFLLGLGTLQHRSHPRGPTLWATLVGFGLVNVTIAFAAMFGGTAGLATGTAAVLANAQPLLILVPAWWLFHEPIDRRTAVSLVVGFAGLMAVALPGGGGSGALLSLLSAAAVTTGTLVSRRLRGTDVVMAVAWHLVIGGAALAILAGIIYGAPHIEWTLRFVLVLAYLAIIGTALSFVAWVRESLRCPLGAVSAWMFLVPIDGVALGAIVLGERPTIWSAAGLSLVLGALWFALHPPTPREAHDDRGSTSSCGSRGDSVVCGENLAREETHACENADSRRPHGGAAPEPAERGTVAASRMRER